MKDRDQNEGTEKLETEKILDAKETIEGIVINILREP